MSLRDIKNYNNTSRKKTKKKTKKNGGTKYNSHMISTLKSPTMSINKKKFRKLKCAPKQYLLVDKRLQNISCYSNQELFKFKEAWNDSRLINKIKTNNPP